MSKFMFNSFAKKKKTLYQYKKTSFLGVGGRVPEKQEVSPQIISGKEACIQILLMVYLILEGFFTRR